MTLSKLVALQRYLDDINTDLPCTAAADSIDGIINDIAGFGHVFAGVESQLVSKRRDIQQAFAETKDVLSGLRNLVENNIALWEMEYLKQSDKRFEQWSRTVHLRQTIVDEPELNEHQWSRLRSRLAVYNDWRYPGAVIQPGSGRLLPALVSLDPLYLVDYNYQLLQPALDLFNQQYQKRCRRCLINHPEEQNFYRDPEKTTRSRLCDTVPFNQIGVIVAYNFFNDKPFSFFTEYLGMMDQWIRPGGTIIFTFNNCDRPGAVELVEKNSAAFTPGRIIYPYIVQRSFDIVHTLDLDDATTWVEIRKPGDLTTTRGGQAMTKLIAKNANT